MHEVSSGAPEESRERPLASKRRERYVIGITPSSVESAFKKGLTIICTKDRSILYPLLSEDDSEPSETKNLTEIYLRLVSEGRVKIYDHIKLDVENKRIITNKETIDFRKVYIADGLCLKDPLSYDFIKKGYLYAWKFNAVQFISSKDEICGCKLDVVNDFIFVYCDDDKLSETDIALALREENKGLRIKPSPEKIVFEHKDNIKFAEGVEIWGGQSLVEEAQDTLLEYLL